MAQIESVSDDMRRRRWRFIGHVARKDHDQDCTMVLTWKLRAAESEEDLKRCGGRQQRGRVRGQEGRTDRPGWQV